MKDGVYMSKKAFVIKHWDEDKDKPKSISFYTYIEAIMYATKLNRRAHLYLRHKGKLLPLEK